MRVLFVNTLLDEVTGGGCTERTFQMGHALQRAGHQAVFLALDINVTEERKKACAPVETHLLPCLNRRFYFPLFSPLKMYRLIKSVDVIHLIGHWYILNIFVYLYAKLLQKPYVICPAGAHRIYGRSLGFKRIYNITFGNRIMRNAKKCIAVTKDEIMDFAPYGVGEEGVLVVPNGVNEDDYKDSNVEEFRKKYSIGEAPYLLYLGRLSKLKGCDLLLEAFISLKDKYQDLKLVIAGPDESLKESLLTRIEEASIEERVIFIDFLKGKDKAQALRGSETLVIPSRKDAMSIVVLEAGIVKKPVVMTDKSGFCQLEDINGGKLVNDSVDSIAVGIDLLLSSSLEEKEKMGEDFYKYVVENYSWDGTLIPLFELFKKYV